MSRIRSQAWLGAAGSLLLMTSYLACSGMKAEDKKEEPAANKAPSVSVFAPKGAVNTESGYAITFQAEGKDPDMGDTVVAFVWNFGDGTPEKEVAVTAADAKGTIEHAFKGNPGEKTSFAVKVKAKDKYGKLSDQPATVTVTIPEDAGPKGSIVTSGAAIKIAPNESYTFRAKVDEKSLLPGLKATQAVWDFGDGTPLVPVDLGPNQDCEVKHAFAKEGNFSVKVAIVNSLSNQGKASAPVAVEVSKKFVNVSPVIRITKPETPTSEIFTSETLKLNFSLTDANDDSVSYTVNWGDGSPETTGTEHKTATGKPVPLEHIYSDEFTTSQKQAKIVIKATDNHGDAISQDTKTYDVLVKYNALPTAEITTPQASGTLPDAQEIEDIGHGKPNLEAEKHDIVVIPAGGYLTFEGKGEGPSSPGAITYSWLFNGGALPDGKNISANAKPGQVTFAGENGRTLAYKVEFKTIDALKRESKRRHKWVIVDGKNTQTFKLGFLFRKKTQLGGIADFRDSLATKAEYGHGANVQIFQDGQTSSYVVSNGREATASIPVRSNLPFYVKVPPFGNDKASYILRIPNQPGIDPTLEGLGNSPDSLNANSQGFKFENSTWPWNPTLSLVTGTGFANETFGVGSYTMKNKWMIDTDKERIHRRWVDRLSLPKSSITDPLFHYMPISENKDAYGTGGSTLHLFGEMAEWTVRMRAEKWNIADGKIAEPGINDLELIVDKTKYVAMNEPKDPKPNANDPSQSVQATELAPYWMPGTKDGDHLQKVSSATDCFNVKLDPKDVSAEVRQSMDCLVHGGSGIAPLSGGINGMFVLYDKNTDNNDLLIEAKPIKISCPKTNFGYGEYLWSSVWARPLVLNRTTMGSVDLQRSDAFLTYPYFRYSATQDTWPHIQGIIGNEGALNFNVTEGTKFNPLVSPVAPTGSALPDGSGIGRFYWTAYMPNLTDSQFSAISRTWLADPGTRQMPTSFPQAKTNEATIRWGFAPPIYADIDKRSRDAKGNVIPGRDGFRLSWFNCTRDAEGNVVAPDFWVVVIGKNDQQQHFMLPGNYPAGKQQVSDLIMTDASKYLSSGESENYTVAPGSCWFDVPFELRPESGFTDVTVFAVRSIFSNNAPMVARPLNRTDWIESIKTFTAGVQVMTLTGDVTYGHKIALKYPWDIVVASSAPEELGAQ